VQELFREDLRWLCEQGGAGTKESHKNRPVLQHADGRKITKQETREDLGFRSQEVHTGRRQSCGWVEDAMQAEMQKLVPQGVRFWRHPAMGHVLPEKEGQQSCVFITFVKLEEVEKNEEGQVVGLTLNGGKVVVVQ
jgi:hypothetical protein